MWMCVDGFKSSKRPGFGTSALLWDFIQYVLNGLRRVVKYI
jgi:hypothetical protein